MWWMLDVEVVIENPVMLEILQKYKDMGLFGNHIPIFGIGCFESPIRNFTRPIENCGIRNPAFYFREDYGDSGMGPISFWSYEHPKRLKKVVKNVITLCELARDGVDYHGIPKLLDAEICNRAIEELKMKEDLILQNYVEVYWRYYFGWDDGISEGVFLYDQHSGERWVRDYNFNGDEDEEFDYRYDEVHETFIAIHYTDDDY